MDHHYEVWSTNAPRGLLLTGVGMTIFGQAVALKAQRRPGWQWLFVGLVGLVLFNAGLALFGESVKHRTLYESKLGL